MDLVVLLGQTSSGKSESALSLSLRYQRVCVINCDSRQIYSHLNIGTGKIEGQWKTSTITGKRVFNYNNVDHYLIDYVHPSHTYSLAAYIQDWCRLIGEISHYYDVYILTGGSSQWAKALYTQHPMYLTIHEYEEEYSDYKNGLMSLELPQLQKMYTFLGLPSKNSSDWYNSRRLINAITDYHAKNKGWVHPITYPSFDSTNVYALEKNQIQLNEKIALRLLLRIDQGLIQEVESLLYLGDRLLQLGLEYRLGYLCFLGQITHEELTRKLIIENQRYAKRQLTWLQKQDEVTWIHSIDEIA